MGFLSLWAKVFGCAAGMTSGIILVTAAKPVALQLSQVSIDPLLVLVVCTLFAAIVSFVNVYAYLQFRGDEYSRVVSDDEN